MILMRWRLRRRRRRSLGGGDPRCRMGRGCGRGCKMELCGRVCAGVWRAIRLERKWRLELWLPGGLRSSQGPSGAALVLSLRARFPRLPMPTLLGAPESLVVRQIAELPASKTPHNDDKHPSLPSLLAPQLRFFELNGDMFVRDSSIDGLPTTNTSASASLPDLGREKRTYATENWPP